VGKNVISEQVFLDAQNIFPKDGLTLDLAREMW
jgi:hypothetical protein